MKHLIEQQLKVIERAITKIRHLQRQQPPPHREPRVIDPTDDGWYEFVQEWVLYPMAREGHSVALRSTAAWPPKIYTHELLEQRLGLATHEIGHSALVRVARILSSLGYYRKQDTTKDGRGYYWTLLAQPRR